MTDKTLPTLTTTTAAALAGSSIIIVRRSGITEDESVTLTEFLDYLNDSLQIIDSTLTAFAAYNTNGILTQTAADTFTGRTITGTADKITVTNGDGVSGNPTLTIAATYAGQNTIVTVGTITAGVWNGTDIAIADGGTGASTAEAGYTNIADLAVEPAANQTANGPHTNDVQAGGTITAFDLVYLNGSGQWAQTDADAEATSKGLLAISLESKTSGQAMNVALKGSIIRNDSWAWTAGDVLYISTTAGAITATQPSGTDDIIRTIGFALTDDCIFFDPSPNYIAHT